MCRCLVCAVALVLIGASAARCEAYWLFFEKGPGWRPGDSVPAEIVEKIAAEGVGIRTISRYFNAVSVDWEGSVSTLAAIPGVHEISPVRTLGTSLEHNPASAKPANPAHAESGTGDHLLDYGKSYDQLDFLRIPALHDLGLTGDGVVIGVLDGGFVPDEVSCLADRHVAATRNFISGSTDVVSGNEDGNMHGTQVLACLAGNESGVYYGAAFGATYLLALTEDAGSELPVEEDRWVAGVEWCDSLGADIISSSLVYNIFDYPYESYSIHDMDGRTSMVAKAAETAWERGILVVNAAGNEGGNSWNIVATPADAEHVLSVGAFFNIRNNPPEILRTSSRGPTADGRTKPDVVAPGGGVYAPTVFYNTIPYYYYSGTSYSTPLVAGLCALLMEAHPSWTNADVFEAVKNTAIDLGNYGPDNVYGWGVPDGLAAFQYNIPTSVASGERQNYDQSPNAIALDRPYPNPFNASVVIPFTLAEPLPLTVDILDVSGHPVAHLWEAYTPAGSHEIMWHGDTAGSGVYIVRIAGGETVCSTKVMLLK